MFEAINVGILKEVLKNWDLNSELTLIRRNENDVYEILGENLVFRITHKNHRAEEEIQAELQWIEELHSAGIRVARSIPSKRQNNLQPFVVEGNQYYAVVFEKAKGRVLSAAGDFDQNTLYNWGELLGSLHQITKSSQKYLRRDYLTDDGIVLATSALDKNTEGAKKLFSLLEWLKSLPQDKDSFGLIHADVHHGNFFVTDNKEITLFDFDDCHYHWFAYDIAVVIHALMAVSDRENLNFNILELYSYFLDGYRQKNTLDEFWLNTIPQFIQYRSALLYNWILGKGKRDGEWIDPSKTQSVMDFCLASLREPISLT